MKRLGLCTDCCEKIRMVVDSLGADIFAYIRASLSKHLSAI